MKVKQVGIEAGNLQRELHPQLTRDKVAMKILVIKDVLNENRDCAEKAKDDRLGLEVYLMSIRYSLI
jgi:hypothetical protein